MSINSFFTPVAQSTPTPQAGAIVNLPGIKSGGLNVFDIFFTHLQAAAKIKTPETKPLQSDQKGPLESENPALNKHPHLDIAELLAATPEIEKAIKALPKEQQLALLKSLSADQQEALSQTLALNQQAFDDILKPTVAAGDIITTAQEQAKIPETTPQLLDALHLNAAPSAPATQAGLVQNLITRLKAVLAKLEGGTKLESVAALNLTPQETAQIVTKIKAALKNLETLAHQTAGTNAATPAPTLADIPQADEKHDDVVDLILALNIAGILQEAPKQTGEAPAQTILSSSPALTAEEKASLLKGRLHAVAPGSESFKGEAQAEEKPQAQSFSAALDKQLDEKSGLLAGAKAAKNNAKAPALLPVQSTAAAQIQASLPPKTDGFSWMDWARQHTDDLVPLPWSNTGLTSTISYTGALAPQGRPAYLPHPAMQTIAASISRAAGKGDDTMFRLQLDPPELGRIDVKMTFGKDKSVKAVVTAEKPETYMMLQRDSHVLERSLQDAGLDTNGALSFALAQDGSAFSQNGGHDGQRQQTGGGKSDETVTDLTDSVMTWQIDPASGRMRFNILA